MLFFIAKHKTIDKTEALLAFSKVWIIGYLSPLLYLEHLKVNILVLKTEEALKQTYNTKEISACLSIVIWIFHGVFLVFWSVL